MLVRTERVKNGTRTRENGAKRAVTMFTTKLLHRELFKCTETDAYDLGYK